METETENQSFYMNHFVANFILPCGKAVSVKVYAIDKQGVKQSVWHCQPHAIIESIEEVSPY